MIYHRGAAEALGVSPERLENMGLREVAERAYERGLKIDVGQDGVGPGLTLATSPAEDREERDDGV